MVSRIYKSNISGLEVGRRRRNLDRVCDKNGIDEGLIKGFKRGLTSMISFKEGAPFPLMFGTIIDPRIAQVRITDDKGLQQMAKVVREAYRGYSLWFALLPNLRNTKLNVEGMDGKGRVIFTNEAHIDHNGGLLTN